MLYSVLYEDGGSSAEPASATVADLYCNALARHGGCFILSNGKRDTKSRDVSATEGRLLPGKCPMPVPNLGVRRW